MPTPRRGHDRLFIWFMGRVFLLMVLWGIGTLILLLFIEDVDVTIKRVLIQAWTTMFTAYISLAAGYLIGRPTDDALEAEDREP